MQANGSGESGCEGSDNLKPLVLPRRALPAAPALSALGRLPFAAPVSRTVRLVALTAFFLPLAGLPGCTARAPTVHRLLVCGHRHAVRNLALEAMRTEAGR